MNKIYYYGLEDEEEYYNTDICEAYELIRDYNCGGDVKETLGLEIIEMVASKISGIRWCNKHKYFEPECSIFECEKDYKPVNGKNGICKHLSWSLIATGRKWVITGDHKYKKISGRTLK